MRVRIVKPEQEVAYADEANWRTIKQFADEFQVTERTVWRWIKVGHLKVHRFGRTVRISPEDRRDFIDAGRV